MRSRRISDIGLLDKVKESNGKVKVLCITEMKYKHASLFYFMVRYDYILRKYTYNQVLEKGFNIGNDSLNEALPYGDCIECWKKFHKNDKKFQEKLDSEIRNGYT